MIMQTTTIELEGFASPKVDVFAPGVRFVSLNKHGRPSNGMSEISWQGSRNRKILLICTVMLCTALLLSSILFRLVGTSNYREPGVMPMAWTAQSVEPKGLKVQSGTNEVVIPVGSRLPNGEVLLSVSTDRMTYSTTAGVTTLSARK